jgi:hypothetical protein
MMGGFGDEPATNEPVPLIQPLSKREKNPMASVFNPSGKSKYVVYADENSNRSNEVCDG